ncbi:MAG TPA: group II intron reverse transcriptase/maturase [Micromonosporaceae bacterium]|nr:group II intron reverse transcriptase/maturase [Micromonosporaceae bacterium]HCU51459.1 group II intron reverse transcriptase/maturase [Micromonosporaceae bacterium]
MNTDELESALMRAEIQVLEIQTKLHRWANDDHARRFDDLFNLVVDPRFLLMAWARVAGNKGARSAGVDGHTVGFIRDRIGVNVFLAELREQLKSRSFRPLPVRERMIPKPGSHKQRRLGIPTIADRVVQGSLKLVLEPIFEADFMPCSYGFRPGRRAHDAIAETVFLTSKTYEWVLEGDITACFDEISHPALMDRVRLRVGDKRVLALVKAFLKAGILTKGDVFKDTDVGSPQGGILSPLLSNVALSVLDEHFAKAPGGAQSTTKQRWTRRQKGLPNYRLLRYADDFVIVVSGTQTHTETLLPEVTEVLATMGLRLSQDKTIITHIDEGLDFLGWRIQRHQKRGTNRRYVYNYPAKKALRSIKGKTKAICRMNVSLPLSVLLHKLNFALRGWTTYFRPGVSSHAFQYLRMIVWRQVFGWLRRKHLHAGWKELRRRYCDGGWWPRDGEVALFNPGSVATTRYRPRGTTIPSPWPSTS